MDTPNRKYGHAVLVWSFVILACVTAIVAVGHWGGKIIPMIKIETPMPLTFPVKILANIGALMLLAGLAILTVRRLRLNPEYQGSSFYDWYLLGIIWLVAVTGVLSQCFRLADAIKPAFVVYYLHLCLDALRLFALVQVGAFRVPYGGPCLCSHVRAKQLAAEPFCRWRRYTAFFAPVTGRRARALRKKFVCLASEQKISPAGESG